MVDGVRVRKNSCAHITRTRKKIVTNTRKVIDRYSQVHYYARIRSVMHFLIQKRSNNFLMRYCAEKGGIIDGD